MEEKQSYSINLTISSTFLQKKCERDCQTGHFFCGWDVRPVGYEKLSALMVLVFSPKNDLFHIRYVLLLWKKW